MDIEINQKNLKMDGVLQKAGMGGKQNSSSPKPYIGREMLLSKIETS